MAQSASWAGTPEVRGTSEPVQMALLTFSMIGLQFVWGIEMTYCTPYLLQLGLSKSKTSLVWIAGPLSGLVMQPVIGVVADSSRSKWGRRRPFMVGGAIIVAFFLLVLGWTKEIVTFFHGRENRQATILLAVFSIYTVDFAVNAIQSCSRSLIVDTLPISKQQLGSAWAGRMVSIGHLIGYIAGTVDLVSIFGKIFGDSQFKQLTLISASALLFTTGITTYSVQERVLLASRDAGASNSPLKVVAKILKTTLNMPERIRAICWVQFWSYIGWFPFLFYSTTWVGETYFRYDAPESLSDTKDALGQMGRIGSLSLVIFSLVSFVSSIFLPPLIDAPEDDHRPRPYTPRALAGFKNLARKLNLKKPDLPDAWRMSFILFAGAMILAPLANSTRFATILVTLCGLPWALQSWAPFSMLGIEVNKLSSTSATSHRLLPQHRQRRPPNHHRTSSNSTDELAPLSPSSAPGSPTSPISTLHLNLHPEDSRSNSTSSTGELSGIYLGILNLFTTMPQFVGNFISMFVFLILEGRTGPAEAGKDGEKQSKLHVQTEGVNAVSVCLAIGGLSALMAAYVGRRLKDS